VVAGDPAWLHRLESCPSTNDVVRARLGTCEPGDCVWTRRQTAGRGQHGRRWWSDEGVLTATFAIHLPAAPLAAHFAPCAGLAVAHAVEDLLPGLRLGLRWPNDVLLGDRKLAGLLCEGDLVGGRQRLAVGVGLNVAVDWSRDGAADGFATPPASLSDHADPPPTMEALLAAIRQRLLECAALVAAGRTAALADELRRRDVLLGRPLAVDDGRRVVRGQGAGIADDGCLLLAHPAGGIIAIESGTLIPAGPPHA